MIPVTPQPEPASFYRTVRQPGLAWLNDKKSAIKGRGYNINNPLPKVRGYFPPYWRNCLNDLHKSYAGICAYLAVYIERATGATSADHFVAKSADAGLAYEWSNYRLACLAMNARKRAFDDVLDPFTLPPDVFRLELVSGRIFINPAITGPLADAAKDTLERLKLDSPNNRSMRSRHYQNYTQSDISAAHLCKMSPFVWQEAQRQGLL